MGNMEGSPQKEVNSNTSYLKKIETFQINNPTVYLQELEEQQQTKPGASKRKEISVSEQN